LSNNSPLENLATEDSHDLSESEIEELIPITYSNTVDVSLTRTCRNTCGYCDYQNKKCSATIPYTTIKIFKDARKNKAREANILAGERPDKFNTFRSKLDLWGFETYVDYVYTICELAFLEGLLTNLHVGYLTLPEIKRLKEIVANFEMNIETTNKNLLTNIVHQNSPSKDPDIRLKFLRNCGKAGALVTTGIMVGLGESPEDRIEAFHKIRELHEEYGHVQFVKIQNFIPKRGTPMEEMLPPSELTMLETVSLAKDILPSDIKISVPININQDITRFLEYGVTDLGQINVNSMNLLYNEFASPELEDLKEVLKHSGYRLEKRLPILNENILEQRYSKKVGQLLDKYRVKLKAEMEANEE
jgi:7,8-didemethyl-8-hydroxy-5-deazariboflavin synthase